jgi:hypothetical protein
VRRAEGETLPNAAFLGLDRLEDDGAAARARLDAPGYEAVATCLASPEVRARTEGVIAWRPQVA